MNEGVPFGSVLYKYVYSAQTNSYAIRLNSFLSNFCYLKISYQMESKAPTVLLLKKENFIKILIKILTGVESSKLWMFDLNISDSLVEDI